MSCTVTVNPTQNVASHSVAPRDIDVSRMLEAIEEKGSVVSSVSRVGQLKGFAFKLLNQVELFQVPLGDDAWLSPSTMRMARTFDSVALLSRPLHKIVSSLPQTHSYTLAEYDSAFRLVVDAPIEVWQATLYPMSHEEALPAFTSEVVSVAQPLPAFSVDAAVTLVDGQHGDFGWMRSFSMGFVQRLVTEVLEVLDDYHVIRRALRYARAFEEVSYEEPEVASVQTFVRRRESHSPAPEDHLIPLAA